MILLSVVAMICILIAFGIIINYIQNRPSNRCNHSYEKDSENNSRFGYKKILHICSKCGDRKITRL